MITNFVKATSLIALMFVAGCANPGLKELDFETQNSPVVSQSVILLDANVANDLDSKPIILLTCQSYPSRELDVYKAFISRAKQKGANAMVIEREKLPMIADLWGARTPCLFKAKLYVLSTSQIEVIKQAPVKTGIRGI